MQDKEEQLEKDLTAINRAHSRKKLHHYVDQPNVEQMKQERWKKFEKFLDVFCVIVGVVVAVLFIGMVVLIVLVWKGLGL